MTIGNGTAEITSVGAAAVDGAGGEQKDSMGADDAVGGGGTKVDVNIDTIPI